jgi:phenylalanyl-tRNA synthetase beta chain
MALANPISAETAVMRTRLWPGLLQALRYNLNRQQSRVRLFESGAQYRKSDGKIVEEPVLAGVVCGNAYPEQWGMDKRPVDFFDLKADVEALLGLAGGAAAYTFEPESHRALHPGQAALIRNPAGETVGQLGLLHPEILRAFDIAQNVLVFELILTKLQTTGVPLFQEVSKFPAIRRDLAIIVDDGVPAQAIRGCIDETAGGQLQELQLFDVYRGKGIESGRKSVALGLTLQDNSRTLTDGEIDALLGRILERLQSKLGASLRE